MARRRPRENQPTPTGTNVTNVANTGQRSVSIERTGATGAVRNTVNISQTPGQAGRPGSTSVNVVTGNHPTTDYEAMARERIAAARAAATAGTADGWAQATASLAHARQQALGAVPAEYRDTVNERFNQADEQVRKAHERWRNALGNS